ncbi:MAG TPA: VOC family protein [Allosphingosinicella sp.]|nr:VOC family protein [Allosphingosinicella sp.]
MAPEIPVASVDEAALWYAETLGFRTTMKMPGGDYAIVERDGAALHLFRGEAAAVSLHIFVGGIEALAEELEARGAPIAQPLTRKPWGARDFRLFDPSGNELKFTEGD